MAITGLKSVAKTYTKPIKEYNLPLAVVYNAGERTSPMGDANAGQPKFDHRLSLIIDIIAADTSDLNVDADIVTFVEAVKMTLLSDTSWLELFEAVEHVDVSYSYPKDGEDYIAQGQIEFELFFRSMWPPLTPNDFREATVKTKVNKSLHDNPVYTEIFLPKS
ncbi:hypothetical protein [Beijerinckia sp. L45]|uniref:hypothetical protein n=1 Tax=Beijerinckia sp. L45 TaxID=1641855 RepID=UPI00131EC075|nr:hypothetical protein [Beijerinckia sp. L45]